MRPGDPASPVPRYSVSNTHGRQALARSLVLAFVLLGALTIGTVANATGGAAGWQGAELGLSQAWPLTQGSPSVVVAIVDTGVQADHPALAGHVLAGYDFVNQDADASDDNGHGTALAGIVASVCPFCRILPVKVLAANMTGNWGTIAAGVTWAADHGAQVINLSVGGRRAPDVLAAAIAGALAKGVIVVAAAGNDGQNESFYPAMYPGVVSVAGIDQNDVRYQWSNFGPWVTVAAPGCTTAPWLAGGYEADFCGTSTAAPFVAGVAALARSLDPALTPAQFTTAVNAASDPLPDAATAAAGRIDANRLLHLLAAAAPAPVATVPPTISQTPTPGLRLTANNGAWQSATAYTIRWQRSRNGSNWQNIGTGATYVPNHRDIGYQLRIVVTATNTDGAATVASTPTAPVRAAGAHRARS